MVEKVKKRPDLQAFFRNSIYKTQTIVAVYPTCTCKTIGLVASTIDPASGR